MWERRVVACEAWVSGRCTSPGQRFLAEDVEMMDSRLVMLTVR